MKKVYALFSAAALAIAIVGCGSKDDGAATTTSAGDTPPPTSTTGSSTTGTTGSTAMTDNKSKVVGMWKVDTASIKGENTSDADKKQAEGLQMEFKDDMTFTMSMGTQEAMKGTWEITGSDIKLKPEKVADPNDIPTMTLSEDGSRIHTDDKKDQMDFVKA